MVGWSSAGHAALTAAWQRPELFASLFVYEPGVPSYVEDAQAQADWQADAQAAFGPVFGPVFEAAGRGDYQEALRRLIGASSARSDAFDLQSRLARQIQRDNLRTLPQLLFRQEAPLPLSGADLASIRVPTCMGYGAGTRPIYGIVGAAAQQWIPVEHLVVPNAGHMWPDQAPEGVVAAVADCVRTVGGR